MGESKFLRVKMPGFMYQTSRTGDSISGSRVMRNLQERKMDRLALPKNTNVNAASLVATKLNTNTSEIDKKEKMSQRSRKRSSLNPMITIDFQS